jgi:hypothetical protein
MKEVIKKKVRRGRKKLFNKNKESLDKNIADNKITYNGDLSGVKKAGNEGDKHITKKIEIALNLFNEWNHKFTDQYDGVYLEYPLIEKNTLNDLSVYNKKKLNYLLSIYQDINGIKNLENIFNANLRSSHRSKKCLKNLHIKKIIDICVVSNGEIVEIIEIKITNGLTKKQYEELNTMYPGIIKEI